MKKLILLCSLLVFLACSKNDGKEDISEIKDVSIYVTASIEDINTSPREEVPTNIIVEIYDATESEIYKVSSDKKGEARNKDNKIVYPVTVSQGVELVAVNMLSKQRKYYVFIKVEDNNNGIINAYSDTTIIPKESRIELKKTFSALARSDVYEKWNYPLGAKMDFYVALFNDNRNYIVVKEQKSKIKSSDYYDTYLVYSSNYALSELEYHYGNNNIFVKGKTFYSLQIPNGGTREDAANACFGMYKSTLSSLSSKYGNPIEYSEDVFSYTKDELINSAIQVFYSKQIKYKYHSGNKICEAILQRFNRGQKFTDFGYTIEVIYTTK